MEQRSGGFSFTAAAKPAQPREGAGLTGEKTLQEIEQMWSYVKKWLSSL